ncbi:MAG: sugar phosphate isomerase/epimerase [Verrucomicrobia bacterium]|nr:sugar phosphate isomerase/epimerase [Verrucomicrobiota bacterium]
MKLSCIPWAMILGWPDDKPELTVEELIDLAVGDYHLDGIEILNHYFRSKSADEVRKIRDRLLQKGLAVSQYSSDSAFALVEGVARNEMVERLKRDIDKTIFFNAGIMRITGGDPNPAISRGESFQKVIHGLAEVLPYAEQQRVVLALENHVVDQSCPEIGGRLDEFMEILARLESPFLRANFDTSNALKAGEDPLVFLETAYAHVVHLHISDHNNRDNAFCPVGEGDVDLSGVFKFLKAHDYDGWVSVECSSRGRAGLDRSVGYVRGLMRGDPSENPLPGPTIPQENP